MLTDRALAGSIVGVVLSRYAGMATASALVYVIAWFFSRATSRPWPKRTLVVVVLSVAVIACSHWLVAPQVAALRTQMALQEAPTELTDRFDSLHRLVVILFGVQWLLSGVALALHARLGVAKRS